MEQHALLIFARRPELGKVKTRLAAGIGDTAALHVYRRLLEHTRSVARQCPCDTHVFLTDAADDDFWNGAFLHLQSQGDLGVRMETAFTEIFKRGYQRVVIIGSDCPGLQPTDVTEALKALDGADLAIGPAEDGGYYLLGMKRMLPELFRSLKWSTAAVLADTLSIARQHGYSSILLTPRSDVDTVEDLPEDWLPELNTPA